MAKLNRIGEEYKTNTGYSFKIIKYNGNKDCSIEFFDGIIINNLTFGQIKNGYVKYPNKISNFNVGFVGEGIYTPTLNNKHTSAYICWSDLLGRIYGKIINIKEPTYKNCTISEEWLNFQNFADFYYKNCLDFSFQIDKDIILKNNKHYSSETCCFVPNEINMLFRSYEKENIYGEGIRLKTDRKIPKFTAQFRNIYLGKSENLETIQKIYFKAKEQYIHQLAEKYKKYLKSEIYTLLKNIKL